MELRSRLRGPTRWNETGRIAALLCYGQAYVLKPDHAGPCDVDSGKLFGAHGAIVQSDSGSGSSLFVCCEFPERGAKRGYYNIAKGTSSGEPGGMKASYGRWALWLDKTVTQTKEDVPVVRFPAPAAAARDRA